MIAFLRIGFTFMYLLLHLGASWWERYFASLKSPQEFIHVARVFTIFIRSAKLLYLMYKLIFSEGIFVCSMMIYSIHFGWGAYKISL